MSPGRNRKLLMRCFAVLLGVGVAFLVARLADAAGIFMLHHRGEKSELFLINSAALHRGTAAFQQSWGSKLVLSHLDPPLGFAHNPHKHPLVAGTAGSVAHGLPASRRQLTRIVALGGSTTDPPTGIFLNDPGISQGDPTNWPRELARLLNSHGSSVEVLSGGVAGCSSNQERLKLLCDVIPLGPRVVLSLVGVNDAGFFHVVVGHPMVHPYQRSLFENIATPSGGLILANANWYIRLMFARERQVEGVNYGTESGLTPA